MGEVINWDFFERYKEMKRKQKQAPSIDQLSKDWNENILPQIKHGQINPLLQEMKEARLTYFSCLKEYYSVLAYYQNILDDIYQQESYQRLSKPLPKNELRDPRHFRKLPLITPNHLRYIQRYHEIPSDILEDQYEKE